MYQTKIVLDKEKADADGEYTCEEMRALIDRIFEECEMKKISEDTYELIENHREYDVPVDMHIVLYVTSELERVGHIIPCISEWKEYDDFDEPGKVVEEDALEGLRKYNPDALTGIPQE